MTRSAVIIGCGRMGREHAQAYRELGVPIQVACDADFYKAQEFAQEFGNFIAWGGAAALAGVRGTMEQAGIKPPKIKSVGDLLGFLVQMPQIQAAIEKKMVGAVEGAVAEGTGQVAKKALDMW